jgi:DICT domain-containing protein
MTMGGPDMEPGSAAWRDAVDRVVERTARDISRAFERMEATLPEGAAAQIAVELVIARLAHLKPWFTQLIMEDDEIRESYEASVAERPAKPEGSGAL